MKKIDWKRFLVVLLRGMLSILLIIGVSLIPLALVFSKLRADNYINIPVIKQCVIELWNIDTFEGGTSSKTSFLSSVAIDFEKENNGCYIMVKNKTLDECLLAIEQGQVPDMFSFGAQAGKYLKQHLQEIDYNFNINPIFLDSAKVDNRLFACAWCYGIYSLISTESVTNGNDISSIATTSGEQKQFKNDKIKITYSIVFGEKSTKPTTAYGVNFGDLNQNKNAYDTNNSEKSAYDAYCDFVENRAKILLGTQRDVARIENRAKLGKIQDVVYQHIGQYTDLVQYIGVCNLSENKNISTSFIQFLTRTETLQTLSKIGMFAPNLNQLLYTDGVYKDMQIVANTITKVPQVF